MKRTFTGITALLPEGFCKADVSIGDDGRIASIRSLGAAEPAGLLLLPGLNDIHTHGGGGFDFNSVQSAEQTMRIFSYYAAQGVTGVLATLMTDSDEVLLRQLALLRELAPRLPQMLGVHMEGPFLSAAYKGAMPEKWLQMPSAEKLRLYQQTAGGLIRYMTISPELPGATELIAQARELHITVTLGHSGATFGEAMSCVEAGASCFTHTFNAMRPIDHHSASIAAAALTADASCEAILDGKHLCPEIVRMLAVIKGVDRLIGITDSLAVAGMPNGDYLMAGTPVRVRDGDVRLISDNTRAGSTLGGYAGLQNLVQFSKLPVEQAILCFTRTPLTMLGLYGGVGSIEVGKAANLLLTEGALLRETVCHGETLYSA